MLYLLTLRCGERIIDAYEFDKPSKRYKKGALWKSLTAQIFQNQSVSQS